MADKKQTPGGLGGIVIGGGQIGIGQWLLLVHLLLTGILSASITYWVYRDTGWLDVDAGQVLVAMHAVYAICWGAIGAGMNGVISMGKHLIDGDYTSDWDWWYVVRPYLGAATGLSVYVLAKGLGTAVVSGTVQPTGFGVASLAFVGGWAAERVGRKIEEVSKSVFAVQAEPPDVKIVWPAEGKRVDTPEVKVEVRVMGSASSVDATCVEDPTGPTGLDRQEGGAYGGNVPVAAAAGDWTILAKAVVDGEVKSDTVMVHRESPLGGPQVAVDAPGEPPEPPPASGC